ncbi:MAG: FecR family protein, partial [Methanomicrobiales archaeon]|nr:FecR family protein [Methanomicrobiales archaeon]
MKTRSYFGLVTLVLSVLFFISAASAACDLTGTWDFITESSTLTLVITQSGSSVHGNYNANSGKLDGTMSGNTFTGRWSEAPTYTGPKNAGGFVITVSGDCATFTGTCGLDQSSTGWNWRGIKKSGPLPTTVTPTVTPTVTCTPGVESGARFSSLSGQVEIRCDSDPKSWEYAKMNTVINVDDHVKTGEDSSAIIGFADMSTFLLKSESEIVVTQPPSKDSKIGLVAGNIWVNVKKMMVGGTMEVDMSQAVAGIKGTTLVCEETGSSSVLKVIDGTVSFMSKKTGAVVLVPAGQMVTATANGLGPITPFDINAEAIKYGVDPAQFDQNPAAGTTKVTTRVTTTTAAPSGSGKAAAGSTGSTSS